MRILLRSLGSGFVPAADRPLLNPTEEKEHRNAEGRGDHYRGYELFTL